MSQGNQPDELTIVDGNLNNVRGWLMKPSTKGGIVAALGGYIDADEFINHVLIHIQSSAGSKNDLTMFSFAAQYQAIHACAVLGLLPGHQQVALIGQKNGKIRVMPQWQGLKALLERHPAVREVGKPMLVHAKGKTSGRSVMSSTRSIRTARSRRSMTFKEATSRSTCGTARPAFTLSGRTTSRSVSPVQRRRTCGRNGSSSRP
jgi:hypothetical protein